MQSDRAVRVRDLAVPAAVFVLIVSGRWIPIAGPVLGAVPLAQVVTAVVASLLLLGAATRPVRFGGALLALVVAGQLPGAPNTADPVVASVRSYFGVYRIREYARDSLRELVHGTTVHGAQSMRAADRLAPRTYYHRDGPMGDVFALAAASTRADRRVGVVGLGVGSLSCYGRAGEHWTYFEIDPEVVRLARDPRWFSFLRDCPPTVRVTVGDARQTLPSAGPAAFDILVLDAFSSDAIPVHLLTKEAFARYARALAPGGLLAVHISNRHLDLEPVVAAIARDGGWTARIRRDVGRGAISSQTGHSSSIWVALTRRVKDLGGLQGDARWQSLRPAGPLWSDEYSNVLGVLQWR